MSEAMAHYDRRLSALCDVLREAPPPHRYDLTPERCARHGTKLPLWSTLLDAAECCAAADALAARFSGVAIILYTSAINVFTRGLRDEKGEATIARAEEALARAGPPLTDDVGPALKLARDATAHARVGDFVRAAISDGLVLEGESRRRAKSAAGRAVAASHETRHEAKLDGSEVTIIAIAGGTVRATEAEEQDIQTRVEGQPLTEDDLRKIGPPVTSIFPMLVDDFAPLLASARTGALFAIASRFAPG